MPLFLLLMETRNFAFGCRFRHAGAVRLPLPRRIRPATKTGDDKSQGFQALACRGLGGTSDA
ncbi:MAG TPA: hypothetical protein PKY10_04715 [Lentisphaeria bacterium]|nr:hypothetical protein [Lentisphaeria bacterium]